MQNILGEGKHGLKANKKENYNTLAILLVVLLFATFLGNIIG